MVAEDDSQVKTHWTQLNRETLPDMMRHWYDVKSKHPDHLIAYRMGDFYEFFYSDAIRIHKLLGLTLTRRGSGPNRHPLAGIPHKATQHFKSLLKLGETVVVVEQLEDPKEAKGRIVKRGVVQILSPGVIIDDSLLDARNNNYLVSVTMVGKKYGIAFIDLSCGDFFCTEVTVKKENHMNLFSVISRFDPVECILPDFLYRSSEFIESFQDSLIHEIIIKQYNHYAFQYENAYQSLISHFDTKNLEGYGIEGMNSAISAAGALMAFLKETQKTVLSNILSIRRYIKEDIMFLDSNTQKNLEIIRNLNDGTQFGTLISIIDKTETPMGSRLLKKMILQPLVVQEKIRERLSMVELFKDDALLRNDLREFLSEIGDLERIISRINYSRTANARDLINLKTSLKIIPSLQHILSESSNQAVNTLIQSLNDYSEVIDLIERSIREEPPTTVTEGEIIADNYDPRVDEMRDILKNGKNWMMEFEEEQKKKLGISSGLKIGFNRVLGYYIQITKHARKGLKLPEDYIKRQTLKSSVRFETEALKQMEIKILNADETIKDIEYELFTKIRSKVTEQTQKVQNDAAKIALLDVVCSFGEVAAKNDYCRPIIKSHEKIIIKDGRHAVVEQINLSEPFIPNDTYMDTESDQLLIITGPNWSGKSTYLRQVALITIMAQIGSFVPASEAEIGIVDRVFTRVGASDDLTRGQSTFMMEMNETAEILHYATRKSLVIVDELGRGTSTTDGKSIARAVMEYLHEKSIKTLFSTHFHELTTVGLERVMNYHFLIREEGKKLVFLRKLTKGGTDKSYGIHVARMAGVPERVVNRAFRLVETTYCSEDDLDKVNDESNDDVLYEPDIFSDKSAATKKKPKKKKVQSVLFLPPKQEEDNRLEKMIKKIKLEKITPIEALQILDDLKKEVK